MRRARTYKQGKQQSVDKAATLHHRLGKLSPQKRALLEKMAAAKRPSPALEKPPDPPVAGLSAAMAGAEDQDPKLACRLAYDTVSRQLDSGPFGEFSFFLNYGYVPDLSPQFARVAVPEHYINKNSVRLVLELIGDCPTGGRSVLDVGCGRGAIAHVLTAFCQPARVAGLDLSPVAIGFCRKTHRDPRIRFLVGDAENLPFASHHFDIVTNLESSSCYPNLFAFYREVQRVLVPGGYFLYSDCLPPERMREAIGFLASVGLRMERDRDITANVLLSCDQVARGRVQAYGASSTELENFLGAPGSQYYESMRAGRMTYRILKLRKG